MTHPADVHFYKHSIRIWQDRGHDLIITSRDKDITVALLDRYGFSHYNLGKCGTTPSGLARELFVRCAKLLRIVRRGKPDIMTNIGGTFIAPIGRLTRIPTVTFYDTENATISNLIAYPLSHHLLLPSCYTKRVRRQYISYNGYHELAYLHPDYFSPDPTVLEQLGVREGEKFVVLRFVSWQAGHDIGHQGISLDMKRKVVNMFSQYARIFITSEKELPPDLEHYSLRIPPEKIHDALYYATMLYGESATMASECAVLGTPAIFLDNNGRGYTDEQERVYQAVFNFSVSLEDQEKSIDKGVEILQMDNVKTIWSEKKDRILHDTIDVTRLIVDTVERLGRINS